MTFTEVLDQIRVLVQSKGRVSYRALKIQFNLDNEYLEALKDELIAAEQVAADEGGKVLVWTGGREQSLAPKPADAGLRTLDTRPASYTPPHLAQRILAEQAAMEARGVTGGERKTITALFADLKGSTALIERLDPEEARALIDPALQLMMEAVHRYEGYVAQVLGDGIFALFGAPIAHEDHPQRALYAALMMQEAMRRYADTLRAKGRAPLLMRVGVNTGEVVVRSIRKEDLHTDYVPVGRSTNLAARMEQLAAPGSILVSEQTHRLTDGYFEFKALGKTQVKGVEEPLNVYEVIGAGPLRTRLQVAARRGLTRFIGRQSELGQLQGTLNQAKGGDGQIVGVRGEPGLGKSRLFYEFKLLSQEGCLVLEAYAVSHGKASPYLPLIELLKQYLQIQPQDDDRTRREKIIGKVIGLDRGLEDLLPYLFTLLGIDDPTSSLRQMDPQIRRRRTFDALRRVFLRESLNQPLILVFEDLHWIDTETQGFLDTLSESVASARILLLVNYRPEYRHDWGTKTYYTQLRLAPLGKEEAEEFLTALLGEPVETLQTTALHSLTQLILEKTEGTPFFMEEVVQTLAEEGVLVGERGNYRLAQAATELHISPTVQGVLAARIDRLSTEEKDLLQQVAVIGREFSLGLVRRVVTQSEDQLYRLLAALQSREFLYEQPAFPEVDYIFKHALTQEVAYNSLLLERRKALHERTAQAIEELYSANVDDHYGELAHHYSRSGNTEKAVEYLRFAGQQATQRSAHADAMSYLSRGVELLQTLPDTPRRAQQELALLLALGTPLTATRGYAAPEVEHTYIRALELCRQLGETPDLFLVLFGLWRFHLVRGESPRARDLAAQCLRLAQSTQDADLLMTAHLVLGLTLFDLGELAAAQRHLEQSLALYNPQKHRPDQPMGALYGQDPKVVGLSYAAMVSWVLGYPDQALTKSHQAVTAARELAHPFSLIFALDTAGAVHRFRREARAVQEQAESVIALAREQGFPFWLAAGTIGRGWALVSQGQVEEGIEQIQQGWAARQVAGAGTEPSYLFAMLAEVYQKAGKVEKGLLTVDEGIAKKVSRNGESCHKAELYRLKGELTRQKLSVASSQLSVTNLQALAPHLQAEAEECFHQALEITRRQEAKSLELRATVSLARLWQQQAKQEEARQLLAEICHWFTEGFDTADLQEAKSLLEALER